MKNQYLISIPAAAKEYGINRTKLYELVYSDPTIPVIKIGDSTTKINRPLFEEWLNEATHQRKQL